MAKTWTEKFNQSKKVIIKTIDRNFAGITIGETLVLPSTQIIDDYVRAIPKGKQKIIDDFRKETAKKFKVNKTCPVMTNMNLKIVAELAAENIENKNALETVSPFWRLVKTNDPITKKLSFSNEMISQLRKDEGLK
jgi:uncharacterized membrane protein